MSESQQLHCRLDIPYPPVCVREPNQSYARAMLDNMGGHNCEMNAISLYQYNHLITCECEEITSVFLAVSMVEMQHMNIFGQLSLQLGENPRLWGFPGGRRTYWSPSYNRYPTELRPLLMNAISGEHAAIQKYEMQLNKIKDETICENLKRIILDEQLHIRLFEDLVHKYAN